jgi:hypothetical protein
MIKILEFKEFKKRLTPLFEDDPAPEPPAPAPAADVAPAPAPAPEPAAAPPPMDMGAPAMPPDPNAAPAGVGAPTEYQFVFIQDAEDKSWKSKDFKTKELIKYSVTPDDLNKWIDAHNFEKNPELAASVKAALTGTRPMTADLYDKFKEEIKDGLIGTNMGSIELKFDSESDLSNPSTDASNINVGFVKSTEDSSSKKKK